LKLVDGLRALDPATRRAAIMAMDVADETWSMEQVLADADAKVAALRGHQRQMQGTADAVVQSNRERIVALESSRDGRVAELRQQIAALEAQIQDAIGTTAADVAKLQSESESNKAALLRETQRIDAHILNLDELVAQFRPPAQ
jgi:Flp pilus assembly secretin CpaC